MKKFKIIFATVMLGIATVGGFQAYEYANMSSAEVLLLENAEALTQTREGDNDNWLEYGTYCDKCEKSDVPSCLWSHYDEGGACTTGTCPCGETDGVYFS